VCLDGIRGPGSSLLRPTSTPTLHQIGLFVCGKLVGYPVQGFHAARSDSRGKIVP